MLLNTQDGSKNVDQGILAADEEFARRLQSQEDAKRDSSSTM